MLPLVGAVVIWGNWPSEDRKDWLIPGDEVKSDGRAPREGPFGPFGHLSELGEETLEAENRCQNLRFSLVGLFDFFVILDGRGTLKAGDRRQSQRFCSVDTGASGIVLMIQD